MPIASGFEPQPLDRRVRSGKERSVGPEARRPPSDRKAEALVEGVAHPHAQVPSRPGGRRRAAVRGACRARGARDRRPRIEGANATLFEGPVTTTQEPLTGASTKHQCDGTMTGTSPRRCHRGARARRGGGGDAVQPAAVVRPARRHHQRGRRGEHGLQPGHRSFCRIQERAVREHRRVRDPIASGDRVLFAFSDGASSCSRCRAGDGSAGRRATWGHQRGRRHADRRRGGRRHETGAGGTAVVGPFT